MLPADLSAAHVSVFVTVLVSFSWERIGVLQLDLSAACLVVYVTVPVSVSRKQICMLLADLSACQGACVGLVRTDWSAASRCRCMSRCLCQFRESRLSAAASLECCSCDCVFVTVRVSVS